MQHAILGGMSHPNAIKLAERLAQITPGDLTPFLFCQRRRLRRRSCPEDSRPVLGEYRGEGTEPSSVLKKAITAIRSGRWASVM